MSEELGMLVFLQGRVEVKWFTFVIVLEGRKHLYGPTQKAKLIKSKNERQLFIVRLVRKGGDSYQLLTGR